VTFFSFQIAYKRQRPIYGATTKTLGKVFQAAQPTRATTVVFVNITDRATVVLYGIVVQETALR
jgi:hypothetical protein